MGQALKYKQTWGSPVPVKKLNDELSGYIHQFTLYGAARPAGCSVLLGAYDALEGPALYMVEPSGVSWGYYGAALGKNKTAANAEIEKLKPSDKPVRELVKEAARIIYATHDETKDKAFELEMSWVCAETNGQHSHVPDAILQEAEAYAQAKMDEDSDDDDDE